MPNICGWNSDVFSKSACSVYANTECVFAQMSPSGQAISTGSTNDMSFAYNHFSNAKMFYVVTAVHNPPYKFMPNGHRGLDGALCPFIPFVNMHICPANRGLDDFDKYVVIAHLWLFHRREG